jgi:predicted amidohydrolase
VVYANRPGGWFSGYSAVFDPHGRPLVNAGTGEAVIETRIDLGEADRWREEEAIFPHRRPVLYRHITRRLKGVAAPSPPFEEPRLTGDAA